MSRPPTCTSLRARVVLCAGCRYAPGRLHDKGVPPIQRVFSDTFHVTDWAPTLLSLVDQGTVATKDPATTTLGDGVDGHDMTAAIRDGAPSPRAATGTLVACDSFQNTTAFILGKYKLVLGLAGNGERCVAPQTWRRGVGVA